MRRRLPEVIEPLEVAERAGLRDRDRARLSRLESDPDPSFSSAMVSGDLCRCWRAVDRVTGAKYESLASDVSDGVGEGEMTLGVEGIAYGYDMVLWREEGYRSGQSRRKILG